MIESLTVPGATGLPPIVVTRRDHDRLRALAERARGRADVETVEFLVRELDRAEICRPDAVPPDVVTMNARVLYRRHLGLLTEARTLVYDAADAPIGASLPILSPLGVALLGLRAGDRMPYASPDGARATAVIEHVAYQPEAAGRLACAADRYWPRPPRPEMERLPPGHRDGAQRVVPLRRRPQPRPARPDEGDDPPPDSAA